MKRGIALFELVLIVSLIGIVLFGCIGYLINLYKLTQLDFKAPYKAEGLRAVGAAMPPIGAVIGFIDIKDDERGEKMAKKYGMKNDIFTEQTHAMMKNDIFTEQTHAMMKDFFARQNEIMMNILAAHEISEKDMIAYGSKQIQGEITTFFYKEKPIAEFFKEKIEVEGTTVRIIQGYRILN